MTSAEYQTFAAFRLRLADYTLDENLPPMPVPPTKSCYALQPSTSLGSLDKLPLELLEAIIPLLDLQTLMAFRCVNQRSLQLVASLTQYKMITSYAVKTLQGALAIGYGKWITCHNLFTALCIANCEECGEFGGYLYLLTCSRVCYLCFTRNKKYLPIQRKDARRVFQLRRQKVNQLPRMISLPGRFPPFGKRFGERLILVDFISAQTASIVKHGSSLADGPNRADAIFPTPSSVDTQCANPLRFMAVVRAPWFKKASGDVEWGLYCPACQKSSETYNDLPMSRHMFPLDAFKEHLKVCGADEDQYELQS